MLDLHVEKASENHYKKGIVIADLFVEDQKHFLPLPAQPFNVCRYESYKADGYGKICVDGRHFYSTCPENHHKRVMVGIRAHYIDILTPLERHLYQAGFGSEHMRMYQDARESSSKRFCKTHRMMLVQGDIKYEPKHHWKEWQ
ncbi:MAG: hypothetical protein LUE23_08935 [Lachnospiraceae bacterium]|nr:hypothetical protein [Lachnospiraceae bacterium]